MCSVQWVVQRPMCCINGMLINSHSLHMREKKGRGYRDGMKSCIGHLIPNFTLKPSFRQDLGGNSESERQGGRLRPDTEKKNTDKKWCSVKTHRCFFLFSSFSAIHTVMLESFYMQIKLHCWVCISLSRFHHTLFCRKMQLNKRYSNCWYGSNLHANSCLFVSLRVTYTWFSSLSSI